MADCIFCRIIAHQAPADVVFEDERVVAFWDIHPLTAVHILIVPKKHLASVNDVAEGDEAMLGHLFSVARQVAAQQGVAHSGYRLVVNTGPNAGQGVFHIHMHLLGGQRVGRLVG